MVEKRGESMLTKSASLDKPTEKPPSMLTIEEFSALDPKVLQVMIVRFEKKFFGESVSPNRLTLQGLRGRDQN